MNLKAMMQLQNAWSSFSGRHPKFAPFLRAARNTVKENTVIEIRITTEDGRVVESNLKITGEDLQLIEVLKQMQEI